MEYLYVELLCTKIESYFNIQRISSTASSSVRPWLAASLKIGSTSGAFAMASFKWLNACSAFLYFPVGLPKHVLWTWLH